MPPPLKLAVIGGGPSAFYVASRVLQLLPRSSALEDAVRVHVYDRLWTPHGLVRYGVAPDHPEVKNCTHKFDEVAMEDSRFSFFGNTNIGNSTLQLISGKKAYLSHTLPLELNQILQNYTHLLIATGSPLSKLHPSLHPPSESTSPLLSSRVLPALSLVHWYTQHPSNQPPPPLETSQHVTIVGMGNVALDVARILLRSVNRLEHGEPPDPSAKAKEHTLPPGMGYDLPNPVLSLLRRSTVKHVSILGRRGPLEAAFTAKELREMVGLEGVGMRRIREGVLEGARMGKVSRQQGRILQLLEKANNEDIVEKEKSWSLEFFRSPMNVRVASPDAVHGRKLELDVSHTKLEQVDSGLVAVPTGETSVIATDMAVTSLGFEPEKGDVYDQLVDIARAKTSPEAKPSIPRSGRIQTDSQGRVLLPPSANGQPTVLKNVYASGWASMGARGVLAATMADAYGVAESIVRDYTTSIEGVSSNPNEGTSEGGSGSTLQVTNPTPESNFAPPKAVVDGLKADSTPFVVSYQDWKRVDEEEVRRGGLVGKERERMGWSEVVDFLRK